MNRSQLATLTSRTKGCPLACLFVMLIQPPPFSPKELVFLTGYNIKTVREALHKLRDLGLAGSSGNERWSLTNHGYQLPLGGHRLPPESTASSPPGSPDGDAEAGENIPAFDPNRPTPPDKKGEKFSAFATADHPPGKKGEKFSSFDTDQADPPGKKGEKFSSFAATDHPPDKKGEKFSSFGTETRSPPDKKGEKFSSFAAERSPPGKKGEKFSAFDPLSGTGVPEREKNSPLLPRSSSSSYIDSNNLNKEELLLQQQAQKREKICAHLTNLLVDRCACPKALAETTIREALAYADLKQQDHSLLLEWDILRWLAWCLSTRGEGIRNIGVFIASKIQNVEACPDWFQPEAGTDLSLELSALEDRLELEERMEKEPSHES